MPASGHHLAHHRISFVLPLSVPTKPEEHEMGQGFPTRNTKYKNSQITGAGSFCSSFRMECVFHLSGSIVITSVATAVSNCISDPSVFWVRLYFWFNCILGPTVHQVQLYFRSNCISVSAVFHMQKYSGSVCVYPLQLRVWGRVQVSNLFVSDRSSCCVPPPTTTLCNMYL